METWMMLTYVVHLPPGPDFAVIRLMLAIAAQNHWEVYQVDYSRHFFKDHFTERFICGYQRILGKTGRTKCEG